MPYEIRKDGPEDKPWCVYNKDTGERKGCTTSKAKAEDMIKAIGASAHKALPGIKSLLQSQEKQLRAQGASLYPTWNLRLKEGAEADAEVPLVAKQALESLNQRIDKVSRAFDDFLRQHGEDPWDYWVLHVYEDDGTFIIVERCECGTLYRVDYTESDEGFDFTPMESWVEVVFAPVEAKELEGSLEGEDESTSAVSTQEGPSEEAVAQAAKEVVSREEHPSMGDMLRDLWNKFFGKSQELAEGSFFTLKQKDGRYRWVAISSTAFLDRTGDIVTRQGIAKSLERAPEVGYGPLLYWHEPSIEIGTCDFQLQENAVLIESGCWLDTPLAEGIRKGIGESKEPWGVSIGFLGIEGRPGVVKDTHVEHLWEDLQIVERSIVPEDRAAAHFSRILTQDGGTSMRTDKKERLVALVGPDLADKVEALADDVNAKATEPDAIVKEAPEEAPEEAPKEDIVATAVARLKEVDPDLAAKLEKALAKQQTPPVASKAAPDGSAPETAAPEGETQEPPENESDDGKGLFAEISAMLATVKEQLETVQKEVQELKGEDAPKAFTGIPEGIATVQVKDRQMEKAAESVDYPEVVKEIAGTIVKVHAGAEE